MLLNTKVIKICNIQYFYWFLISFFSTFLFLFTEAEVAILHAHVESGGGVRTNLPVLNKRLCLSDPQSDLKRFQELCKPIFDEYYKKKQGFSLGWSSEGVGHWFWDGSNNARLSNQSPVQAEFSHSHISNSNQDVNELMKSKWTIAQLETVLKMPPGDIQTFF